MAPPGSHTNSAFVRYSDSYAQSVCQDRTDTTTKNIVDFWHNHVNEFLTKGDLVFARTLKCGSSFYMNLLLENGWKPIRYDEIAWGQQTVFAFIMDPWRRRYAGLAEDLHFFYDQAERDLLMSLNANFLARSIIGEHSIPLNCWFGQDKLDLIDWIPLDADFSGFDLFAKLLQKHEQRIVVDDPYRHQNKSGPEQQALRDQIRKRIESNPDLLRLTYLLLSRDIDLYNRVVNHINPGGNNWDEISWLRSNS